MNPLFAGALLYSQQQQKTTLHLHSFLWVFDHFVTEKLCGNESLDAVI